MDPEKKHGSFPVPPKKATEKQPQHWEVYIYFSEDEFFKANFTSDHYFAQGWVSNKGIKAAAMQIQDSTNRTSHKQTIVSCKILQHMNS